MGIREIAPVNVLNAQSKIGGNRSDSGDYHGIVGRTFVEGGGVYPFEDELGFGGQRDGHVAFRALID